MEEMETKNVGIPAKKTSHEPFFGFLVMMIIIVLLVLLASYGGWFLYRGIQKNMDDADRLSIADIPRGERADSDRVAQPVVQVGSASETSPPVTPSATVNKKVIVKVLNGGAVKGSAGTVSGLVSAAGYTSVTTGNSVGDYAGLAIYFMSPVTEVDANAVRDVLIQKYPSVTVKPSVSGNRDTQVAPITVIVGK